MDDPTIRTFCFQMHNTGPSHFQSQGGKSFVWPNRINSFRYIQAETPPTSQVNPWLVALMCDNLCPLSQSCIKLSICTPAQNCTTDFALSQQAPSPPGLNALPPIAQLHWKQGICYCNNCAQCLEQDLYTQE